jgi:hypothetical protein
MRVLVSSGAAATGVVLGILMALAIGAVEGSTADLDSTATDTPSDLPTAVDGGIDSTELATRAALDDLLFRPSWSATRWSRWGEEPSVLPVRERNLNVLRRRRFLYEHPGA